MLINPSKEIAHENPSFRTICAVSKGKDEDMMKRMNVVAAITEAP